MCSETVRGSWATLAAGVPLLAAALELAACGHKARPVPPPRMIPATTAALKAHQRGMEAVLQFPYPATTLRGAVLSGLAKVDLYQYTMELPAEALELQRQEKLEYRQRLEEYERALAERGPEAAVEEGAAEGEPAADAKPQPAPEEPSAQQEEPPAAVEEGPVGGEPAGDAGETAEEALRHPGQPPTFADLVQVDPRTFEREATLLRSLEGEELAAATLGRDFIVRLPLAELPAEGATGYVFAVRTTSLEGLPSSLSNFARLVPQPPPAAPGSLTIEGQPRGIEVVWTAGADPAESFKIYRREAQTRVYGTAVASPLATARSHTDYGAVLGSRYIYTVTAVEEATPLVESSLSAEREIYYQDRFAPAAPAEVAAFPDEGAVRVLWEPPVDEDVAGYIVYRRSEGGNARALMEAPAAGLEYIDREAPAGSILLYAVVAVDDHGNRSDASAEVRVRVP
jgi:hypothetical protein